MTMLPSEWIDALDGQRVTLLDRPTEDFVLGMAAAYRFRHGLEADAHVHLIIDGECYWCDAQFRFLCTEPHRPTLWSDAP